MQIVCSGTVTVYVARGEMQLVVDNLTRGGQGQLHATFEALKEKLATEGLFAVERKRAVPTFPQSVGIVTSASGAAIHDIFNVLRRRAPDVRLMLRPVKVQGDGAAEEIAAAIEELNQYGGLDVLIVGRGGGSIEDLWAFNEEVVARAIVGSRAPVISAVGHETDYTIADFVADLRAPTPSAAAELVAKNRQELESHLDHLIMRLQSRLDQSFSLVAERLAGLEGRLKLAARDFKRLPEDIATLEKSLSLAMSAKIREHTDRLGLVASRLHTLSPLLQLDRGYVIASHEPGDSGLVSAESLEPGDHLWLRFACGQARTRVEEIDP
jgi:exodeoxyribonuclease VII large subunit